MQNKTPNPLTVLHIVPTLGVGGMENGIVNLCNHHHRDRFTPMICCLKTRGEMAERLSEDVHLTAMALPEGKPFFQPFIMAKLLKKLRPDIVHTHGLAGGSYMGIMGAKLAGIPVIVNGEHGSFFLKRHQLYLQKVLAQMTKAILSVSESLKKKIIDNLGIPGEKIIVIPNGVNMQTFSGKLECSGIKKEIETVHGISVDDASFVIASVGSLKPEKNQSLLLKALCEIKKMQPQAVIRVLLAGDGIDRPGLERFVSANGLTGNVVFLGKRNDVPKVLAISDALVSTSISRHEGMSNVILEAFASGLPVIATKSVGTAELVRDGQTGFLTDQQDASDLARKIIRLWKDPALCRVMGQNAVELTTDRYSIAAMVAGYEKLYTELALDACIK